MSAAAHPKKAAVRKKFFYILNMLLEFYRLVYAIDWYITVTIPEQGYTSILKIFRLSTIEDPHTYSKFLVGTKVLFWSQIDSHYLK